MIILQKSNLTFFLDKRNRIVPTTCPLNVSVTRIFVFRVVLDLETGQSMLV